MEPLKVIVQYKPPMKGSSNNLYSVSVGRGLLSQGEGSPAKRVDGAFRDFLFLPGVKGLIDGKMSVLVIYCCATSLPPKLVA